MDTALRVSLGSRPPLHLQVLGGASLGDLRAFNHVAQGHSVVGHCSVP